MQLSLIHISPTVNLSPSLGDVTTLNGIFADKNVVYIQLETINTFLVDGSCEFLEELNLMPDFKKLISESYFFENFYSNVGSGNSSDAEISGLTGLYTCLLYTSLTTIKLLITFIKW